jgi:hypothetical protein
MFTIEINDVEIEMKETGMGIWEGSKEFYQVVFDEFLQELFVAAMLGNRIVKCESQFLC